jgi:hypothetical protein
MMTRLGLLILVTAATLAITVPYQSSAQTPCYLPDGSMYIGVQRPAECSPVRPKGRDAAMEQSAQDAAARRTPGVAETTGPAVVQDELNRRVRRSERTRVDPTVAERALKECDSFKYRPSAMNPEQSAVCNRYWQNKATKTLQEADQ